MGIGGVSHGEKDVAAGNASPCDPALEGRRKYAEGFGQGAAAVDAAEEARRRAAAADEVMKQLLGALLRLPSSANCCTPCTACPQICSRYLTACGPAFCAHIHGFFHPVLGIASQGPMLVRWHSIITSLSKLVCARNSWSAALHYPTIATSSAACHDCCCLVQLMLRVVTVPEGQASSLNLLRATVRLCVQQHVISLLTAVCTHLRLLSAGIGWHQVRKWLKHNAVLQKRCYLGTVMLSTLLYSCETRHVMDRHT